MKRLIQRLGAALIVTTAGAMLAPMATAEVKAPILKPSTAPLLAPAKGLTLSGVKAKPAKPQLHPAGSCGVGQIQCFLGNGKVPASIPADSPDNVRPKVCAFKTDPAWNCGKCERCVLYKTAGAFCGPKGCDYKECLPNFADLNGNRADGCETWVPIKKPVPPRQPPANMAAKACNRDSDCGTSVDIRCIKRHPGVAGGTCGWWTCQAHTTDCNYLPAPENFTAGTPACVGGPESDGHGCGYSYPWCRRFSVPSDIGLCRTDMSAVDADGDGFGSIPLMTGADGVSDGTDCDDGDPARFPTNIEVCDATNHDEDCDPTTHGTPAAGQAATECCNLLASGAKSCGPTPP